jgi:hypothetical protein
VVGGWELKGHSEVNGLTGSATPETAGQWSDGSAAGMRERRRDDVKVGDCSDGIRFEYSGK